MRISKSIVYASLLLFSDDKYLGTYGLESDGHQICNMTKANLELMILQDATGSFRDYVSTSNKVLPTFLTSLRSEPKSFTLGAAIFGDKPMTAYGDSPCFETVLPQTKDLVHMDSGTFSNAISKVGTMKQKLTGGDDPEDSASGVIRAVMSGEFFSEKKDGDEVVRIVMIVTDDKCQLNKDRNMGIDIFKEGIPCTLQDRKDGNFPSDQDVRAALKLKGVSTMVLLAQYDQMVSYWKDRFSAWGVPQEGIFPLDLSSDTTSLLTTFHNSLKKTTCRTIKDLSSTTTTSTTTLSSTTTTSTTTLSSTATRSAAIPPETPTTPSTTPLIVPPPKGPVAEPSKTAKVAGAVVGASAGALLLGGGAYLGVQALSSNAQGLSEFEVHEETEVREPQERNRESITQMNEEDFA